MYHLVCVHPFAKIKRGDRITDPAKVARYLNDRGHHFVKVAAPVEAVDRTIRVADEPFHVDVAEFKRGHGQ